MIAEVGDKIQWSFGNEEDIPEFLKNKTFVSEVIFINEKDKHYGVFTSYGQDLINFDKCKIITFQLGINLLIEKYEDKIKSIENIIDRDKHWTNRCIDNTSNIRLNTRIYERKTFLEDLKNLLGENHV